jgi:hypothetical protein
MTRALPMAEIRCSRCRVLLGAPTTDGAYFTLYIPSGPCGCGSREAVVKLKEPYLWTEESTP